MKKTMTITNSEWMIKNKIDFSKLRIMRNLGETFELFSYSIFLKGERIATITTNNTSLVNALLEWLDMEHKEPILDDVERRYLSAVIRPFRDDVQYIVKYGGNFSYRAYEDIAVRYQDKMCGDTYPFILPRFEKGTMYKGMEVNRHYTLKELGL